MKCEEIEETSKKTLTVGIVLMSMSFTGLFLGILFASSFIIMLFFSILIVIGMICIIITPIQEFFENMDGKK